MRIEAPMDKTLRYCLQVLRNPKIFTALFFKTSKVGENFFSPLCLQMIYRCRLENRIGVSSQGLVW